VAIDEAQDRSALEVKVLVEAVHAPEGNPDQRSVTIAGDTAQRLVFDNNFTGWADLLAQTGQPAIVRPLKLSYRSTAEVMLLAREVLGPELAPDEPLAARPGEPVELHEFGDIGEAVAFLSDALRGLMAREPSGVVLPGDRPPPRAGRRLLRRPAPRRGPVAAPGPARRVQLPARRRPDRRHPGQGPRVRLRHHGRLSTRAATPTRQLGPPPHAHRRHPRRPPAVAGLDRRAEPADPEPCCATAAA
jgi:hypothetical protein